jgi:branched-chain amino acid transport system permease protein
VTVVCLVVLGGLGSIRGVLVGAAIVAGFNNLVLDRLANLVGASAQASVFAQPANWKFLAFGLCLVLCMRLRPGGLLAGRRGGQA